MRGGYNNANRQFQAKTSQHKNSNISENYKTWFNQNSRTKLRPSFAVRGWSVVTLQKIQYGWRPPSWKSLWRHNSTRDGAIWAKFGRQMQNDMPMTMQRWKSKPEVEFQHGGRLFSKTGRSNISAVNWDISPKFGLRVHFHFLKWANSRRTKPEVEF